MPAGGAVLPQELNVLALVKGKERYIFVYDDESRAELIDALRHHAADPEVNLTWFDALVLTKKAREQEAAAAGRATASDEPPADPRERCAYPWA